ncbi:hypothetical protein H4S01_002898 [Coemansia sp. RSA 2610]|nr:hypothetical protein IWW54_000878 [Coemansia sp. RSA 2705]KAJ2320610.1 hypothetical protein IWW52_001262 [Coemansia sp. RSA 2704]KAJ2366093.1 hypothetical protein H4S01_002898 [Coemansia sp. RSA 2610]
MYTRQLARTVPGAGRALGRRFESTVKVGETAASAIAARPAAQAPRRRRALGGFRGGVVGFLLGVTSAGALGFVYLIDEYQKATALVLSSVDELEKSSLKVKEHVGRIEQVGAQVRALQRDAATAQQLAQARADWRKQNDILTRDHLELKAHVWEIEQDVESALGGRARAKKQN